MKKIVVTPSEIRLLQGIKKGKYSDLTRLASVINKGLVLDYPVNQFGKPDVSGNYTAYKLSHLGEQCLQDLTN